LGPTIPAAGTRARRGFGIVSAGAFGEAMHRLKQLIATGSVISALASAVALYAITQQTRFAALEVAQLEKAIETQEAEMVILRAELANRSRPDRIAGLARRHLGLRPLSPAQVGSIDQLPWREGAVAVNRDATSSP
jgi:cell division protein FtsL